MSKTVILQRNSCGQHLADVDGYKLAIANPVGKSLISASDAAKRHSAAVRRGEIGA